MKFLNPTIVLISLVSLFTDFATEMLYPILPLFLQASGFSILFIGFLEGLVEAISGFAKIGFGKLSDSTGKRVIFIRSGYLLSAVSKPLMALVLNPIWVLLFRSTDRVGKGIRTGARDALLADNSILEDRGKVFGFHRGMDTLGAALGPSAALVYLYFYPGDYRSIIFLSLFPGILAVLLTYFLREKNSSFREPNQEKFKFFAYFSFWAQAPKSYKKIAFVLFLFTFFNSSDVFLLLSVKNSGISDSRMIMLYIFYNLVFAVSSFPLGILGDKIGLKKVLAGGFLLFSIIYTGFGWNSNFIIYIVLFFFYGLYSGATEGLSKAAVSKTVEEKDNATALGFFSGVNSILTLLSSSIAGLIWFYFDPASVFYFSGISVFLIFLYFIKLKWDSTTH